MNYSLTDTAAAASEVIERAPSAIVNVDGTTATERKLSVVRAGMSRAAMIATAGFGGKTGKEAMMGLVSDVAVDLAKPAAWPRCDYRPLAETIAAQLGEVVVISNRSTFEAQVDLFDAKIMTYKQKRAGKGDGYKVDAKTGTEVPDATLSKLMSLRQLCSDVTRIARELSAQNKEAHEKAKVERDAQQKLVDGYAG